LPLERTERHLQRLYAASADPWGHLTRDYERSKYADTLAALEGREARLVVEVGCGIGVLTELLAPRCGRLFAIDLVPAAVRRARSRLAWAPHVTIAVGNAPDDLPALEPDIVMLSEVLYFLTTDEIDRLARWCDDRAAADARIVIVSWLGPTGEALDGAASAEHMCGALAGWSCRSSVRSEYRIDILERCVGQPHAS
jgi:trans-aconitate methyltransferase